MLAGQTLMSDLLLSLSEPRQANRRLSVQDQRLTHITDIQSDKSLHKKDQEMNILGPSHAKLTISPFGSVIEHCSYGSNITSILWCVRVSWSTAAVQQKKCCTLNEGS